MPRTVPPRGLRGTRRPAPRRVAGFTLAELLVVVALSALLTGLLLPATLRVAAAADRLRCQSNLRLLGRALRTGFADWAMLKSDTDLDPVLAHLASGATLARSVEDRRSP